MDEAYLRQALHALEKGREMHEERYGDNPHHQDCLPRLDKVIETLSDQLEQEDSQTKNRRRIPPRLDFSVSETALPDAIEAAAQLEMQARLLEQQHDPDSIMLLQAAREILFKELNELDGFDR
jgi:hypothetical protein